ncbi:helix-turn-helix transcriptional regulator [Actinocrispum wychmicini]|uniref:Regulatory LuxR family protein n=1 Tax=Actinocrispum wychmicini TaxID=1213861 RepID=A0A4R2J0S6_9PSEU|nr:LuxR family transcriptional regulator [Actinocrispum wychmicini]TCO49849.1 regulatory LuxR family protein [Actinocrispum wychmicini]
MLVGRSVERAAIDALLADAAGGRGGALVLRGEAGIGKTALCDYAEAQAGTPARRTTGAEGESGLGYAALQRLVPELTEAIGPDPFAVAVKALTWISDAAPVLIVVDDAHWIDPASAQALLFVARRIEREPVAMLFATRGEEFADLPESRIEALAEPEARELLRAVHGHVQPRVLADAAGNPLALVEQSRGGRVERMFARQVADRVEEERIALLLVAAAGHANELVLRRAARILGVTLESDLLRHGRFRHPLMRSAVYDSAFDTQRWAVHYALAEAHDDPDERIWHRSKATAGPDEDVAGQLAEAATRMAANGAYLAASDALERAAELGDEKLRGERLTQAAEAAWHGGDGRRTSALLDAARVRTAQSIYLRGAMEVRSGVSTDAVRILVPGIAMATDPGLALRMLLLAREAAFNTAAPEMLAMVEQVPVPKPDDRHEAAIARIFELFRSAHADPALAYRSGAMRYRDECVALITELGESLTDPELLQVAGGMAHALGEAGMSRALRLKAVAVARERAALGILATTLESIVDEEVARGRFDAAEQAAEEGHRLAIEAGRTNSACVHKASLSLLAGLRGREQATAQILTEATERQLVRAAVTALRGVGLAALAAGRFEDAVRALETSAGGKPVPGGPAAALSATPDLVEAAVRAGDPARAHRLFEPFRLWVESLGSAEFTALLARCRALLDDDPEPHFRAALAAHAESGQVFEHARTRLLYGEFLRRDRRRAEAREPLRDAMETFERLGTPVWAARAAAELRATGETVRSRTDTTEALTPQERQIAEAAGAGATNREIAARLFLSPRTVDYHLRKVFRKLGISSRTELIRATR